MHAPGFKGAACKTAKWQNALMPNSHVCRWITTASTPWQQTSSQALLWAFRPSSSPLASSSAFPVAGMTATEMEEPRRNKCARVASRPEFRTFVLRSFSRRESPNVNQTTLSYRGQGASHGLIPFARSLRVRSSECRMSSSLQHQRSAQTHTINLAVLQVDKLLQFPNFGIHHLHCLTVLHQRLVFSHDFLHCYSEKSPECSRSIQPPLDNAEAHAAEAPRLISVSVLAGASPSLSEVGQSVLLPLEGMALLGHWQQEPHNMRQEGTCAGLVRSDCTPSAAAHVDEPGSVEGSAVQEHYSVCLKRS